jgi:hypothetical protein
MGATRRRALFPAIEQPRQRAVLHAYITTARISAACAQAGVTRYAHYYWLKHDAAYQEAFASAHTIMCDGLEDEARRRARGWEETRATPTGQPYTIFRYSDILLIFLLKGAMPEKYGNTPRRDDRHDMSELLKAVLLELAERSPARDVIPDADWAPRPPDRRPARTPLPPPPESDEERQRGR